MARLTVNVREIMTIIIPEKRILFVSAPKVACSSIKTAFFEIENGFPFRPFYANGVYRHIHDTNIYPAIPFERVTHWNHKGFFKITMVRDPISRFLSAYSNRILYYRELSAERLPVQLEKHGLLPDPPLSVFIEHFEEYRRISNSIRLHTDPLTFYLGTDPRFYNQIFNIHQVGEFDKAVSNYIGIKYKTPHLQVGGPKLARDDLTRLQINKILAFYSCDYDCYGEWFEKTQ